jgi:glycosyltransferase involved in cell wall biosynthesis
MIANSTHTRKMISKYYGRESAVIFPPVDVERFAKFAARERHGFVTAGRQTPYKRFDLAVAACSELGLPLTVVGDGPEHDRLVKMAGPTVTFVTNASDEEVAKRIGAAEAFIFPTDTEDFGVIAVEAMAAGTPVIAYRRGGPLDFVVEGETGLFFDKLTTESLGEALKSFKPANFDSKIISKHAELYSVETFHKNIREFVHKVAA